MSRQGLPLRMNRHPTVTCMFNHAALLPVASAAHRP